MRKPGIDLSTQRAFICLYFCYDTDSVNGGSQNKKAKNERKVPQCVNNGKLCIQPLRYE